MPAPEIGGTGGRGPAGSGGALPPVSSRAHGGGGAGVVDGAPACGAGLVGQAALVKTPLPGEVSGAQIVQSVNREESNDGTHET